MRWLVGPPRNLACHTRGSAYGPPACHVWGPGTAAGQPQAAYTTWYSLCTRRSEHRCLLLGSWSVFSAFPPRGRGQGPLLADSPGSPRPTALRFPATLSDASKAGGPERLLRPPPKSPFSSVVRTGSVIWVESRVVRTPLLMASPTQSIFLVSDNFSVDRAPDGAISSFQAGTHHFSGRHSICFLAQPWARVVMGTPSRRDRMTVLRPHSPS